MSVMFSFNLSSEVAVNWALLVDAFVIEPPPAPPPLISKPMYLLVAPVVPEPFLINNP